MNEVATVYDCSLGDPPQLEIEPDVFKAWTQGVKVSELVSTLKSALLAQYELEASAAGSGYAPHAQLLELAQQQQQREQEEEEAEEEGEGGGESDDENEHTTTGGEEEGVKSSRKHTATATADLEEGYISEEEADTRQNNNSNPPLKMKESRRQSAASISGVPPNLRGSTNPQPRSTPSLTHRSQHALFSPSPLLFPTTYDAAHTPQAQDLLSAAYPHPPPAPTPSAIDLVTSSQAQARLLWAWEAQLESQYRLYALLEHSLKKPFLLSLHYCIVQLSFQSQLKLTNLYYDFDPTFMRHLTGLKLSTKTRGSIPSMLEAIREERNAAAAQQQQQNTALIDRENSVQNRSRRYSQSSASQSAIGLGGFDSYPAGSLEDDSDLTHSLTSVGGGGGPSVESIRFSSAARQFDNLRRIYRCRWGEKGDGVIGENDGRPEDMEGGGGAAAASSNPVARKREEMMLSERWKSMRAAAVAAMAKRGFGSSGKNSSSSSSSTSTATAHMKAQQWLLRHFESTTGSGRGTTGGGGGNGSGQATPLGPAPFSSTGLIGGLDEFFGFDVASQAMSCADQTAPVFYQQQFRLHSSLARSYSRLVFLSHYRLELEVSLKKKKKPRNPLTFDEVQLLAQILMRCWAVPVGAAAVPSNDDAATSSQLPKSTPLAQRTSVKEDSVQPDPSPLSNNNVSPAATHASTLSQPNVAASELPSALDDDQPSLSGNGAAAPGYDFLPLVAQMREEDEDIWVGDVIDADFIQGLRELKSVLSSKLMEEYVSVMSRRVRDTIQSQQANSQRIMANAQTQANSSIIQLRQRLMRSPSTLDKQAMQDAAAPPTLQRQPSASFIPSIPATPSPLSPAPDSFLRPHMLHKLQSRLPSILKSLHSLALSLSKSKQLRNLLPDLCTEVIKPFSKLAANTHELLFIMRLMREAVPAIPSLAKYELEREAIYPHAYQRRGQNASPATPAGGREESQSRSQPAAAASSTPNVFARAISLDGAASSRPSSPLRSARHSTSEPAGQEEDPLRKVMVHWCRFMDAIGPIAVMLYIKLSEQQE